MNSFQRFGIGHLSASSLNLWQSAPGIFALRYIAKIKDGGNPAMWRGTAVENGLAALLHRQPLASATAAAYQSYDLNSKDFTEDDDELIEQRALIAPMLTECIKWKPPSDLNATQLKIEYFFDPVPIPVIGYLDFAFECGTDIDLKTTTKCPSVPYPAHVRQVSIYRAARNRKGGVLYVTPKRHEYYQVTDDMMNDAILELHAAALSLNNFLARMDTREDVFRSLPVDYSHFQAPKIRVPLDQLLMAG